MHTPHAYAQVIVVGEDIVTFVHPSPAASAAAAAEAAAAAAAAAATAAALAAEDPYADAAADADADALYTRLAATMIEPRTSSLAAATRAYAAAAHADAYAGAGAGADADLGAMADAVCDADLLYSPSSLLSTPTSFATPGLATPGAATPGRASETPRPSCLVSPGAAALGGGAAQPSLMD